MNSIEISEQPKLSFFRTVRITVDGIRYRLFRASVTVAVIAVAVAFLMNILSESLIKRSVARNTRERIRRMHLVYDWSARLSSPGTPESIIEEIGGCEPGDWLSRETARFGHFSSDEMDKLHAEAKNANFHLNFFNELDYAKRRNLIYRASGVDIFERLSTAEGMTRLTEKLANFHSIHYSVENLEAFLQEWPELKENLDRLIKGREAAIGEVKRVQKSRPILEMLSEPETYAESVRTAGFEFDPGTARIVANQAHRLLDIVRIEKSMREQQPRQSLARFANTLPSEVNVFVLWDMLANSKRGQLYMDSMDAAGLDTEGLSPERLEYLANSRRERASLVKAERQTIETGGGWLGLGERLSWLLFVSMLLCGIGIANAMLMTVTERFTEIATLKCLGALDTFIMFMFVLESSFLGVVGGLLGAILGSLIGLGRMLAAFGIFFVRDIPVLDIFSGMGVSVITGVILAALAAVLPAYKAARLAPMEAMRIE